MSEKKSSLKSKKSVSAPKKAALNSKKGVASSKSKMNFNKSNGNSISPQSVSVKKNSLIITAAHKIKDFLDLDPGKRIAIVSDNDADGVSAAVQLRIYLEAERAVAMIFYYDHYSNKLSYPKQTFEQFAPEKTVFLDLADAFVSRVLSDLGNLAGPFISIDHHQREIISGNAFKSLVIKPSSFSEIESSKYPASKMVFDLFGGRDWICAFGVIGDFAFDEWKEFLLKVQKKYKLSSKKLFELTEIIECITSQYVEKINALSDLLSASATPKRILESEFRGLKKLFDARLKILKEFFYKEAECFDDVGICFFKCDNRFASKLSTIISSENQSKTVVIFEQPGDFIKCSIRRQDHKVNCGELAKAAIMGISNAGGGGHIPAAGAQFPPEFFEQFKKQARMYLLNKSPLGPIKQVYSKQS
ncbi:MAG: DHH family phosphoesterase [Candidatus Diapherotrites archaeon]|nr:DHH family phosphoesterase [Candidatus Diapherotrites archaeon]